MAHSRTEKSYDPTFDQPDEVNYDGDDVPIGEDVWEAGQTTSFALDPAHLHTPPSSYRSSPRISTPTSSSPLPTSTTTTVSPSKKKSSVPPPAPSVPAPSKDIDSDDEEEESEEDRLARERLAKKDAERKQKKAEKEKKKQEAAAAAAAAEAKRKQEEEEEAKKKVEREKKKQEEEAKAKAAAAEAEAEAKRKAKEEEEAKAKAAEAAYRSPVKSRKSAAVHPLSTKSPIKQFEDELNDIKIQIESAASNSAPNSPSFSSCLGPDIPISISPRNSTEVVSTEFKDYINETASSPTILNISASVESIDSNLAHSCKRLELLDEMNSYVKQIAQGINDLLKAMLNANEHKSKSKHSSSSSSSSQPSKKRKEPNSSSSSSSRAIPKKKSKTEAAASQ